MSLQILSLLSFLDQERNEEFLSHIWIVNHKIGPRFHSRHKIFVEFCLNEEEVLKRVSLKQEWRDYFLDFGWGGVVKDDIIASTILNSQFYCLLCNSFQCKLHIAIPVASLKDEDWLTITRNVYENKLTRILEIRKNGEEF